MLEISFKGVQCGLGSEWVAWGGWCAWVWCGRCGAVWDRVRVQPTMHAGSLLMGWVRAGGRGSISLLFLNSSAPHNRLILRAQHWPSVCWMLPAQLLLAPIKCARLFMTAPTIHILQPHPVLRPANTYQAAPASPPCCEAQHTSPFALPTDGSHGAAARLHQHAVIPFGIHQQATAAFKWRAPVLVQYMPQSMLPDGGSTNSTLLTRHAA